MAYETNKKDLVKKNDGGKIMIKVLDEKPVPRATVKCGNCDSMLEYGNADLWEDREQYPSGIYATWCKYYFQCPVCGCNVIANRVTKESPFDGEVIVKPCSNKKIKK